MMVGRFILPAEIEYNKIFTDGIEVYIYPSSKEVWLDIEELLKDAVTNETQLFKNNLDAIVGSDYDAGYGNLLVIMKVLDDAS